MAQPTDLMGLGMSPLLADLVGSAIQTVTCTGTSSTTAAPINFDTGMALLNAVASNTGAILSVNTYLQDPVTVIGTGTAIPVVYPPSGHTINGSSSGLSLVANAGRTTIIRVSATVWYSLPTVPA